ncbi:hypothetical protein [Aquipseudomonas alcaligenes]|uniref:PA0061/PA0062 family lipoprotein n=1 Tax=Aquipseudomonas alcaligenes TaxID=43263 RepID=UPI00242D4190|nr:hypothetical protein [Pseudomonas alcaligenes]
MRLLLLSPLSLVLGGCALLPAWHDPAQAWIDLAPGLQAVRVDERMLEDSRYFQVPPGRHALQMRLRFEVAPADTGSAQALPRTCLLELDYAEFNAGQRYRLEAGHRGFRPWAQLRDAQDRPLARAREGRCGEV